jgi:hypothetical protein
MKEIPKEAYRAMLREYLDKFGPNPGNGFNGKSAWHIDGKAR